MDAAYRSPGPHFRNATDAIAVDMHYYNFVDRFDTFGLGPNVPFANGTNSDSLLALLPDGRWLVLRVPYPLGFFTRGMSGRIDDPTAAGRAGGLRDYGPNSVWHIEGGLGTPRLPREVPAPPRPAGKVVVHAHGTPGWPADRAGRTASRAAASSSAARKRRLAVAHVDLSGMWASASTRTCRSAARGRTSATTSGCRSTTRRGCAPIRGTRPSGRARAPV
jgi:hypothetical protein